MKLPVNCSHKSEKLHREGSVFCSLLAKIVERRKMVADGPRCNLTLRYCSFQASVRGEKVETIHWGMGFDWPECGWRVLLAVTVLLNPVVPDVVMQRLVGLGRLKDQSVEVSLQQMLEEIHPRLSPSDTASV